MPTTERSAFMGAIERIVKLHEAKAHDYTDHREFGNFEESARHAGITVAQAIESLIGTKEARRQNLENNNKVAAFESVEDTLLDRAVYCIIRYAHFMASMEDMPVQTKMSNREIRRHEGINQDERGSY
jgi:hypothetical protein